MALRTKFFLFIYLAFGLTFLLHAQTVNKENNSRTLRYVEELLSDQMIEQINKVTQKILEKCTPPDCAPIGVGRSPTPFIAHIDLLYPESTVELPLSHFRYTPKASEINQEFFGKKFIDKLNSLDSYQEESLFKYFDDFLIPQIPKDANTLALIDFSYNGDSLMSIRSYIDKYIQQRNLPFNINSISIAPSGRIYSIKKRAKIYKVPTPEIIKISSSSILFEGLMDEKFDRLAAYERYPFIQKGKVTEILPAPNNSSLRESFLENFKKKIEDFEKVKKNNCVKKKILLMLGKYF